MGRDRRRTVTGFTAAAIGTVVAVFIWSCGDSDTAPRAPTAADSHVRSARLAGIAPEQMGAIHNEALNRVLADLESSAAAGRLNKGNIQLIARASLNGYFNDRGYGPISDEKWNEGIAFGYAGPNDWLLAKRAGKSPVSREAGKYLDRLVDAASHPTSVGALIVNVEGIESSARSELRGTDLNVVLASASVAKGSAQYWSATGGRWRSVLCAVDACTRIASASAAISPGMVLMTSNRPILTSIGYTADVNIEDDFPNGWKVLLADIFGALMGGIVGAAIASMVAFVVQL